MREERGASSTRAGTSTQDSMDDPSRYWLLPLLPDIAYGWANDVLMLVALTDDFEILEEMYDAGTPPTGGHAWRLGR